MEEAAGLDLANGGVAAELCPRAKRKRPPAFDRAKGSMEEGRLALGSSSLSHSAAVTCDDVGWRCQWRSRQWALLWPFHPHPWRRQPDHPARPCQVHILDESPSVNRIDVRNQDYYDNNALNCSANEDVETRIGTNMDNIDGPSVSESDVLRQGAVDVPGRQY
ncbi:uncharacterized protein [Miscanthus floridulus]|uniref:uncharacterized protein n=1 Tax=Miscanthus floridulus TaxID=154761 RepID=UPI00345AED3A